MARLARLALDRQVHLVLHRAAPGACISVDDTDRAVYVDALLTVSREAKVAVHAYAVLPDRVLLLVTPPEGLALTTMMQRLGRRYVGAFNRRHGRTGTPWAGRYRTSVLEPTAYLLDAMRLIETAAVVDGLVEQAESWSGCSAAHHRGRRVDPVVTEHAAFWDLGNTPFDRESAYRRLCELPLSEGTRQRILQATDAGWALGDQAFLDGLARNQARRLLPKRRGRPRKTASASQSDPI